MREVFALLGYSLSSVEGGDEISWVAAEGEECTEVVGEFGRVVEDFAFWLSSQIAAAAAVVDAVARGRGEIGGWRTTEGVVLIDLGPDFGVWAASCPWILDVETSVCGGYKVDVNAEGQQEASGGRHCSRGGAQHGERSEERAVTIIE